MTPVADRIDYGKLTALVNARPAPRPPRRS